MKTGKFFLATALMAGLALTACTNNDDNPTPDVGEIPGSYQITSKELSEVTSNDLGYVIGADGKVYSSVWQAMGAHTETVAVLTYISKTPDEVVHFLAIAYDDLRNHDKGYTHTWTGANETIARMTPIKGCQWRLPSLEDWELILFNNYQQRDGIVTCDEFWQLQIRSNFVDLGSNRYWTANANEIIEGARTLAFRYENDQMTADFNTRYWSYGANYLLRPVLAYNK